MSVVGPRPPVPNEVAKYEPWQRRRLSVRPGLTCIWQVSGRNEISFEQWMYMDLQYIDHWSFSNDISLILKTVPRGADGARRQLTGADCKLLFLAQQSLALLTAGEAGPRVAP
jgi:lipopolysaccharide/colanic/teichoic acid biosynthesis glycosyltransferase